MTLAQLLASVTPLTLLAAVSPVLFVNASTLRLTAGPGAAWRFAAGAAGVLVLVLVLGAGVLGAGLTALVERAVASRTVDALLGALLIGYGLHLARRAGRPTASTSPVVSDANALRLGVVGMATNFTTLPLALAAAQRVGGSGRPGWEIVGVLGLLAVVILVPVWSPVALARVAPGLVGRSGEAPAGVRAVGGWLPVVACLLGGLLLVGRAVLPLL